MRIEEIGQLHDEIYTSLATSWLVLELPGPMAEVDYLVGFTK